MLVDRTDSVLVVIDIQERLAPAITDIDRVIANTTVLLQAARRLEVPILASEQYPRGLGKTVAAVADLTPSGAIVEKIEFSAAANTAFSERLAALERGVPVICGIEAHVCVLQTALDLVASGLHPVVVRDATQSRATASAEAAWQRMQKAGIELVTTEMVVFEWLRQADHPAFRDLSRLIK